MYFQKILEILLCSPQTFLCISKANCHTYCNSLTETSTSYSKIILNICETNPPGKHTFTTNLPKIATTLVNYFNSCHRSHFPRKQHTDAGRCVRHTCSGGKPQFHLPPAFGFRGWDGMARDGRPKSHNVLGRK